MLVQRFRKNSHSNLNLTGRNPDSEPISPDVPLSIKNSNAKINDNPPKDSVSSSQSYFSKFHVISQNPSSKQNPPKKGLTAQEALDAGKARAESRAKKVEELKLLQVQLANVSKETLLALEKEKKAEEKAKKAEEEAAYLRAQVQKLEAENLKRKKTDTNQQSNSTVEHVEKKVKS